MIIIENYSTDPAYNLALEEFLFLHRRPIRDVFFLWQNEPTIVIGRHQNTFDEINREFVEANKVHVVRRNSGGGAVYHDLGNLNFSFLVDDTDGNRDGGFRFDRFTQPVIRTLQQLGVDAENRGRNDIAIDGKKISGNAQFRNGGRLLHHGTILFDSNLENLSMALNFAPEKYVSRAVASIRSRVTN
ncbi:MAG: lipoate--protein ligase family protein, partial [Clostridiales bacterium]|nr:lipoate--protein ligase family protein [Clostridiales bacterium]